MKRSHMAFRWSIILPAAMLIYLVVMAYVGWDVYRAGNYTRYFGIIGIGLFIIIYLFYRLRTREKARNSQEDDDETTRYGTYGEAEGK